MRYRYQRFAMSNLSPVLLAEDNPDDVLLVRRAFKENQAPNPVHAVGNGEEAIQYLAGEGPYADRAAHGAHSLQ